MGSTQRRTVSKGGRKTSTDAPRRIRRAHAERLNLPRDFAWAWRPRTPLPTLRAGLRATQSPNRVWPGSGARSTIVASMVFHCAPNAADPAAVMRSTEYEGTNDGGICGGGGAGAAAGACAGALVDTINGAAAITTDASSLPRLPVCTISSPVFFDEIEPTLWRTTPQTRRRAA
jgi:hypothetical protein